MRIPFVGFSFVLDVSRDAAIAALAFVMICVHLLMRFWLAPLPAHYDIPLYAALVLGGTPLVIDLIGKMFRGEFGSDLLAGISIVTSVFLDEYLAGTLVVLMLSGGEALEHYAVRSASSVLSALASRMPRVAHRRRGDAVEDIDVEKISIGDELVVFPHETAPVDGVVTSGHGAMDESYLTGEPYRISKTPGSEVISGAVNGESALTIQATKLPIDSRYAKIMQVMRASEQQRPHIRRLGDQLGAFYTPLAVGIAAAAWIWSGEAVRFLAVLVIATPCPLLIAIPVAIIGSISLAARRGVIVRDPAALEQVARCRTIIFDKTGTLTYGRPKLVDTAAAPGAGTAEILALAASLERYSKHPLAGAVLEAAADAGIGLLSVSKISERPGEGLSGEVEGREVLITSRKKLAVLRPDQASLLPALAGGLECLVVIDGSYAGTLRFRDEPRAEGLSFIRHLSPRHGFDKVVMLSGDRESEVRETAQKLGITEVHAGKSPEEKVEIVRSETSKARTIYVGDGINDAPSLVQATVGIAFGQHSDVTSGAADAVVLDSSLERVDEFLHISLRMRAVALQSALGGMALSVVGMLLGAAGLFPPVAGAIAQEIIDLGAVLNALRAGMRPKDLTDYSV